MDCQRLFHWCCHEMKEIKPSDSCLFIASWWPNPFSCFHHCFCWKTFSRLINHKSICPLSIQYCWLKNDKYDSLEKSPTPSTPDVSLEIPGLWLNHSIMGQSVKDILMSFYLVWSFMTLCLTFWSPDWSCNSGIVQFFNLFGLCIRCIISQRPLDWWDGSLFFFFFFPQR